MQYNIHCAFTLCFPRSVKRSKRRVLRIFANTGSTVAMRRLYSARPSVESILRFILAVKVSGLPGAVPLKKHTCRTGVRSGCFKHRARSGHGPHADLGAQNFTAARGYWCGMPLRSCGCEGCLWSRRTTRSSITAPDRRPDDGGVVLIARREHRQVELVVDHIVQGVFETAGKNLLRKTDGDEFGLIVGVILVPGHGRSFLLSGVNHRVCKKFSLYPGKFEFLHGSRGQDQGVRLVD